MVLDEQLAMMPCGGMPSGGMILSCSIQLAGPQMHGEILFEWLHFASTLMVLPKLIARFNLEMQASDEEGAAKEEEAEAMRLQQAAAASLRPEDFGLDGLGSDDEASSSGDEGGAMAAGTMAAAADQARHYLWLYMSALV